MNKTIETLLNHRSFRSYTSKDVEQEKLDLIIEAIQRAPSWVNCQHVSVIEVRNQTKRERIAELCGGQAHIAQAPVFLAICGDFYRTSLAYSSVLNRDISEIMGEIDHLIVAAHEVGIALQAATIAAESLGLSTVAIGAIRQRIDEVSQELGLPKYVVPMIGLCVGYGEGDPGLKPRLPQESMHFKERYNTELTGLIKKFDTQYSEYLKTHPWGNRVSNWSEMVADFYKAPYRYYEGETEALKRRGFLADSKSIDPKNEDSKN